MKGEMRSSCFQHDIDIWAHAVCHRDWTRPSGQANRSSNMSSMPASMQPPMNAQQVGGAQRPLRWDKVQIGPAGQETLNFYACEIGRETKSERGRELTLEEAQSCLTSFPDNTSGGHDAGGL